MRCGRYGVSGRYGSLAKGEIAQALFVTMRIVEVHLTHAYQKLGISSREKLPAALG